MSKMLMNKLSENERKISTFIEKRTIEKYRDFIIFTNKKNEFLALNPYSNNPITYNFEKIEDIREYIDGYIKRKELHIKKEEIKRNIDVKRLNELRNARFVINEEIFEILHGEPRRTS